MLTADVPVRLSEVPLCCDCRIPEEGLSALWIGVMNEVVTELPFGAEAEMVGEVIPKLWLSE